MRWHGFSVTLYNVSVALSKWILDVHPRSDSRNWPSQFQLNSIRTQRTTSQNQDLTRYQLPPSPHTEENQQIEHSHKQNYRLRTEADTFTRGLKRILMAKSSP